MIIRPAIDLMSGKCVRLSQGDFDSKKIYSDSPCDMMNKFTELGAKHLHIVDLDSAKGVSNNREVISSVVSKSNLDVQVGGGVKTFDDIDELLNIGVNRVIIGSLAVNDMPLVNKFIDKYGVDQIVLALDVKIIDAVPYVLVSGWQKKSTISLWDICEHYKGIKHILCTDVSRDGMLTSPNFGLYKELLTRYPNIKLQGSGGVSCLDDLRELKELGADSAIVGKAYYEGKLDLSEAINVS